MIKDKFRYFGLFAHTSIFFIPPYLKGDFFMAKFNSKQSADAKIKILCIAAVFCALAVASTFVMHIKVMFLTFDAKDAIITVAGLLFGPVYSLGISLVVTLIEYITIGDAEFWGFLMDFLSTALFSTTCALIYKYKKNLKGAILGLLVAIASMTSFMLLFNLFIVPIYTPNYTTAAVAAMIPSLFLPFNLTKALMNSAFVLMLYKPASTALKAARVLPSTSHFTSNDADKKQAESKKRFIMSLLITIGGMLLALACLLIFFYDLNGKFVAFSQ